MKYRLLKFIIAVLALVVIGLLAAPWYISDPDIEKAIAKDLTFVAAGLIVLAAIGFLVNMTDTKIHEDQAAASGKTDSPFSDNSLFDAKIRAMHERAKKGMHVYPEGHVCKTLISPMDLVLKALDPDDILVDCYGNDKEGYRTRFYGSLDGGTNWYEIKVPSSPADRKTMLKVALGLASVHDFANQTRMRLREKIVAGTDDGVDVVELSSWEKSVKTPDREERKLNITENEKSA